MKREYLIQELWSRLAAVSGVQSTARNPKEPPKEGEFPRINLFDLEEEVDEAQAFRSQKLTFSLLTEHFIEATSEHSGSKELMAFTDLVVDAMYQTGLRLAKAGHIGVITERRRSRVLRPPTGGPVFGLGIWWEIRYVEDLPTS